MKLFNWKWGKQTPPSEVDLAKQAEKATDKATDDTNRAILDAQDKMHIEPDTPWPHEGTKQIHKTSNAAAASTILSVNNSFNSFGA